METLMIVLLLVLGIVAGFTVGSVLTADGKLQSAPMVGSLDFNLYDPSKEFLTLHITNDIDVKQPPRIVTMKVNVLTANPSDS